jgi:hypothetical protein
MGKIIPKVSRRNKLSQCRKPSEQRLEYQRHSFQVRRNMLLHNSPTKTIVPQNSRSFYRIVQNERKRIREAQLHVQRAVVADSFGALTVLAEKNR